MGRTRTRLGIGLAGAVVALAATSGLTASAASGVANSAPLRVREWQPKPSASTLARVAKGAPSVPMWKHTYKVAGTKYKISMVGKDPFTHQQHAATTVPTDILPLRLTFTGSGDVYDPTAPDACLGGATALSRTLASPIFQSHSYELGGTSVGTGQFVDAFQRASFWKQTQPSGVNPGYHVNLAPTVLPTFDLSVSGTEIDAKCGKLAKIDMTTFDNLLLSHLADFAAAGVDSTKFPILLMSNVVLYDTTVSNCCVLGFHAAIENPFDGGVQTLAVADYDSSQQFGGISDVSIVAHEVAEWMDDPIGGNPTPPWGHTGQVSGCQANLEVGDPLTGTATKVKMPGGLVYHPQDLAFASWFYGLAPSGGVNGWYSMDGTFKTPAVPCS